MHTRIVAVVPAFEGLNATVHWVPKFGTTFLTESNFAAESLLLQGTNHVPVGSFCMAMKPTKSCRFYVGLQIQGFKSIFQLLDWNISDDASALQLHCTELFRRFGQQTF